MDSLETKGSLDLKENKAKEVPKDSPDQLDQLASQDRTETEGNLDHKVGFQHKDKHSVRNMY